jgi:hypothetical protein
MWTLGRYCSLEFLRRSRSNGVDCANAEDVLDSFVESRYLGGGGAGTERSCRLP